MIKVLFLILSAFVALSQSAQAQQGATPFARYDVLVIGDNLAGGLGAGLMRLGETGSPVVVTNRFNETSGLARPDFFNWPEAADRLLAGKTFNTAVIMMGVNDRREFRAAGKRFAFGTPDWQNAYAAQVDALMATLKRYPVRVFWIGLPPMADPGFDNATQMMNAIVQERVAAAGATYVDVRKDLLSLDGRYTDVGVDETGAVRKFRSRDGINFFKTGNTKMAQVVLQAMAGGAVPPPPVAAATTVVAPAVVAPALPQTPLLGEEGADGKQVLTDVRDVTVTAIVAGAQSAAATATAVISVPAQAGSLSERMMTTGEPLPVTSGRFDDFSSSAQ